MPEKPTTQNFDLAAAVALIAEANQARETEELEVAMKGYERAIELLSPLASPTYPEASDELASAWTNRGIALATGMCGSAPAGDAIACFERARSLREPLIALPDPWYRYNFAGVLMNLAASTGASAAGDRNRRLRAHEAAVSAAEPLNCRAHPLFTRRRMIALVNCACAFLDDGSKEDIEAAVVLLERSAAVAESAGPGDPTLRQLSAGALANKADGLCRLGRTGEARSAARAALETAGSGPLDAATLEISLKARHSLCAAAVVPLLSGDRSAASLAAVEEAADCAEDGLVLFREAGGPPGAAALASELTRFCAQAYARLRPQFLPEFLREHGASAAPAPGGSRAVAARAVRDAASTIAGHAFTALALPEFDRTIAALRGLREAADELRAGAGGPQPQGQAVHDEHPVTGAGR
jgi:tetratricopeptide (TPR) repeat protein